MEQLTNEQLVLFEKAKSRGVAISLADGKKSFKDSFETHNGLMIFWYKAGNHNHAAGAFVAEIERILAQAEDRIVVCAWCLKYKNDAGQWVENPGYNTKTHHHITHGLCNECFKKEMPIKYKRREELKKAGIV